MENPGHVDSFSKWRRYAPTYARLESQEIDRLYRALIELSEPVALGREQAFERVLPYGFVILNRAENFSSLYLAARLFRHAGDEISSLFRPFADVGYQRALELLIDQQAEATPEIYAFLRDARSRYE
ncbi:MAG TPA: hypothetical protein VLH40_07680, partial [Atribacteraceae bacterium]|nr:hypothetical protein [Atribacteraceae bacterium]